MSQDNLTALLEAVLQTPRPSGFSDMQALVESASPQLREIARVVSVRPDMNSFIDGCYEILDTLSLPTSPFLDKPEQRRRFSLDASSEVKIELGRGFLDAKLDKERSDEMLNILSRRFELASAIDPKRSHRPADRPLPDTLEQITQFMLSNPRPQDAEQMAELVEKVNPQLTQIALVLAGRPFDAFVDGLYQVRDSFSSPSSPFFISHRGSLDFIEPHMRFRVALVDAIGHTKGVSEEYKEAAIRVISRMSDYSIDGPKRPETRPAPTHATYNEEALPGAPSVSELIFSIMDHARPITGKGLTELLEIIKPELSLLSQQLIARPHAGFVDGLYELYDAAAAPPSPFSHRRLSGSGDAPQMEFLEAVGKALVDVEDCTSQQRADAIVILSNGAHLSSNATLHRPASRPDPRLQPPGNKGLRSPKS